MELKEVLTVFKDKIGKATGKKPIAYVDRGNSFIIITDTPNGSCDNNFYEVTKSGINVTNPIVSKLRKDEVRKL